MTTRERSRIVAAMTAMLACAMLAACGQPSTTDTPADTMTPMADSGITTLRITDLTPGTGAEARPGMTVSVHYTGYLYNASTEDKKGVKFDSSRDRNVPFEFPLGAGHVIEGWDRGVAGMKVGGSRVLTIPPAMGYGASGSPGAIPPNATLLFDVELIGVR